MIPNQWYVVLESREVRKGRLVGVTRMGEKMVFWRDTQGKPGCVVDLCPHRGVALSAGKLMGDCIQCPFHGFEFDITGRCTVIPANGRSAEVPRVFKVKSYPLRELHGFIYLWWGEPRRNTLPCPILIICATQSWSIPQPPTCGTRITHVSLRTSWMWCMCPLSIPPPSGGATRRWCKARVTRWSS